MRTTYGQGRSEPHTFKMLYVYSFFLITIYNSQFLCSNMFTFTSNIFQHRFSFYLYKKISRYINVMLNIFACLSLNPLNPSTQVQFSEGALLASLVIIYEGRLATKSRPTYFLLSPSTDVHTYKYRDSIKESCHTLSSIRPPTYHTTHEYDEK